MEVDVFYCTVCNVCKCTPVSKPILTCSDCRLVSYCGRKHQKQDWNRHRKVCQRVKAFLEEWTEQDVFSAMKEATGIKDWSRLRSETMMRVEKSLGRPLTTPERQIFLFPKACYVCFTTYPSHLMVCPLCNCVAYCSEEHRISDLKAHKKNCKKFKLCFELDIHMSQPSFKYPWAKSMLMEDNHKLPRDIRQFIEEYIVTSEESNEYSLYLMSEILTCILTLVYVLDYARKEVGKSLVVHVVGAYQLEFSMVETAEVAFHWWRDLERLELVFVGPDVPDYPDGPEMCERCAGREIKVRVVPLLYHTFLAETKGVDVPDVVVAFNCGLHESEGELSDKWAGSLEALLPQREGSLLAVTSYNGSEAAGDLARILRSLNSVSPSSPRILISSSSNPFSSLRPFRDWEYSTDGVFYQNNYISLLEMVSPLL